MPTLPDLPLSPDITTAYIALVYETPSNARDACTEGRAFIRS